tara:strand:- start:1389 stop:2801 length:1413 start_codon:yes stop_codon:yes gene_type:complete
MPIITTYPFKKAPLNKKDEIILSDALSSDPNFKTKTTDLDQLMKYVQSSITTIEPISLGTGNSIQLTGINGFGTAGQVLAVNQAEDALEYISGGGGSMSVKDANTTVDPTKVLNFAGKIYTVTPDGTDATQANIAAAYNTSIDDTTLVAKDVGSINAGTLASTLKGNDIVDIFDKMFFPTVPPVYVQPTFVLTDSINVNVEVGTAVTNNLTLKFVNKDSGGFGGTMTLSRNTPSASLTPISITPTALADLAPQFPNSNANPNNPQVRQTGTYSDTFTISTSYTAAVNAITYTATADSLTGSQLQDSAGNLSGNAVIGTTLTATASFNAIYPYFWGVSDTSQAGGIDFKVNGYNSSISQVASAIAAGSGLGYNKELALSSGTLTVPFNTSPPTNTTWMWFAYPASNTTKTRWFVDDTNKGDIGGNVFDNNANLFSQPTEVSITTSLWGAIDYKIHIALKSSGLVSVELRNN